MLSVAAVMSRASAAGIARADHAGARLLQQLRLFQQPFGPALTPPLHLYPPN